MYNPWNLRNLILEIERFTLFFLLILICPSVVKNRSTPQELLCSRAILMLQTFNYYVVILL